MTETPVARWDLNVFTLRIPNPNILDMAPYVMRKEKSPPDMRKYTKSDTVKNPAQMRTFLLRDWSAMLRLPLLLLSSEVSSFIFIPVGYFKRKKCMLVSGTVE